MKEIKCPKCGTVFKIDENDYNEILEQVKGEAFAKEIERKTAVFQSVLTYNIQP